MKPILKALTSPFRSSKTKKTKKQQVDNVSNTNQKQTDALQKNIDYEKGVSKDSPKFKDIYNHIEKMVDQLGSMLHFKEKMTEEQKRQLVNQLSSMAINSKRMTNQLMDEEELPEYDEDEQFQEGKNEARNNGDNEIFKSALSEALTRSNSQVSPKSQQSPQKQLKDLFQEFENEQGQNNIQKNNASEPVIKKEENETSLSTFSEIKSQMSKFWSKNSLKVLKLMKTKKEQKSSIQNRFSQSQKDISSLNKADKTQKKKKSLIGSIFPSWNGKKEQKGLNSTAPVSKIENMNELFDETPSPKKQNYDDNAKEQTKITFKKEDE